MLESYQTQDTDVRLLTYQLLVDKFNKKYSNLNESQKNLLREYINTLSNTNSLREFIDSEVTKVKSILKSHLKQVDDKITKIKLSEAIKHTDESVGGKLVKDSHVVAGAHHTRQGIHFLPGQAKKRILRNGILCVQHCTQIRR